jgi:hypothetical protein
MRIGHPLRAHFMQHNGVTGRGQLPGRFRAGKAAADYM